ncbi:hypothetical protein IP88_08240 [alpha proteobacterium AAP81b]|nr:hypothetical protein IP88_08240 [alpha proteobacterium AAP81b]
MILLAAVVMAASPTGAAPRPPAPRAADPAALAAATQLVALLDLKGQLAQQGAQTVEQMAQGLAIRADLARQPGFVQFYQANTAKVDPILRKAGGIQAGIARKVFAEQSGAVIAAATQAYARNYSAAELNGLIAFYRTPTGQAFRAKQGRVEGEIGQRSGQIIGGRIQAGMQANQKALQAALQPIAALAAQSRPARKP